MAKSLQGPRKPLLKVDKSDSVLIQIYKNYKNEAYDAKTERMELNRQNFDCYHLRQDWNHKIEGQSTEFLPKMSMATEQAANFLEQGLVDVGTWFKVEENFGVNKDVMAIKPSEMQKIMARMFDDISFVNIIGDAAKLGLLGSLMISKVHGKFIPKPEFVYTEALASNNFTPKLERKDKKQWQLCVELGRQEDYYPDPTGKKLYEIYDTEMDYHEVLALSEGKNPLYDKKVVEQLVGTEGSAEDQKAKKARETGQNTTVSSGRKKITISEVIGTLLDPTTGKVLHENVVMTIANDQFIIQKPSRIPFWHNKSPFVTAPIISVPHSVWHRALMDAPAALNRAINELANLILDGGLMSVHGIKQIRPNWLEDESQVTEGIGPGTTLKASASCPPQGKVLERVDTSTVPQDGLNVMNLFSQEFNASALTNDLRSGVQSFRAVKATEVVEASNSITSMFSGMVKKIETKFIDHLLKMCWMTIAQHIKHIDENWLASVVGEKRAKEIRNLPAEKIFADTVNGCKFKTFGISQILKQRADLQALQLLLQIIFSSEALTEAYLNSGKSIDKLLTEILKALDIQEHRLEEDDDKPVATQANVAAQGGPDTQSQVPTPGSQRSTEGQGNNLPSGSFATNPNQ